MSHLPSDATLKKFHLWATLPVPLWQVLSRGLAWQDFAAGEVIFPAEQTNTALCILWSGRARVYSRSADISHATLLRTMEAGAIFGVHCIFNADMPPQSTIMADKNCRVLLIPATLWEQTLLSHPPTMANYMRFLTQRIEFLNNKIQYLTAGSAERRLALYLVSKIPEDNFTVRLDLSAVALADLLDLGRASLYRALDKLTNDGFLVRDGHNYLLRDRHAMLAHYS